MLKVPWSCLYNCTLRFRNNNWLHCIHETLSSSGLLKVFYIIFWSVKISREENLLGDGIVMATKLSLSQHVKLATFLRTSIRAKFRNRQIFIINFLNVTLGLSKIKVNITIYLNFECLLQNNTGWKTRGEELRNASSKGFSSAFTSSKGGCQLGSVELWVLPLKPRGTFLILYLILIL